MKNKTPLPPMPPESPVIRDRNQEKLAQLSRGEFTKEQLSGFFGESVLMIGRKIAKVAPVNPSDPPALHRWHIGQVCELIDTRDNVKYTKSSDLLNMARVKVAEEDHKKKKMENRLRARELVEISEVQDTFAMASKVFAKWIDLLPDYFEKKGYIPTTKVGEFVKAIDRVKENLYNDLDFK